MKRHGMTGCGKSRNLAESRKNFAFKFDMSPLSKFRDICGHPHWLKIDFFRSLMSRAKLFACR